MKYGTWLKSTLAEPAALASVDGIALDEPLVQVDHDCNSISGIPAIVQIIAIPGVIDIHIIVVVPVVTPVFWPRVKETEPKAPILEAGIPAKQH
jgi:hypothetical protein